jgi:hypothetical protein
MLNKRVFAHSKGFLPFAIFFRPGLFCRSLRHGVRFGYPAIGPNSFFFKKRCSKANAAGPDKAGKSYIAGLVQTPRRRAAWHFTFVNYAHRNSDMVCQEKKQTFGVFVNNTFVGHGQRGTEDVQVYRKELCKNGPFR